ncbi:MAG: hypothetical protein ACJA1R_001437 [Flavobacteriales bacterium]|jgi:hypothetical protein
MYAAPRVYLTSLALLVTAFGMLGSGCDDGSLRIDPIDPQIAFVGEFLSVPIDVRGEGAAQATIRLERPEVPFASRWISLLNTTSNTALYWDPQADHVGVHSVRVTARTDDSSATRSFQVEVVSAREATPVFLSPPIGVAVDVESTPCLSVPIEVRDNDSDDITLRVVSGLPEGATLEPITDRRATLQWCPSPDQLAGAERWTLTLGADDSEHAETQRDFEIVLLTPQKPSCTGPGVQLPEVEWVSPEEGERVVTEVGYTVRIRVAGPRLLYAPLLFFTDGRLEQRDRLDTAQLDVARFRSDGGDWVATIPTYRLAFDEQKTLTMLVWAVAEGDDSSTRCSLRAPLRARSFAALGAVEAGILADCALCTQSGDCRSGVCLDDPAGARCVPSCREAADCRVGECGDYSSPEGVVRRGCSLPALACEGVPSCVDLGDDAESDEGRSASGQTCPRATDQIHFTPETDGEVVLRLSADAESRVLLQRDDGALLAVSEGRDFTLSTCGLAGEPLLAMFSTADATGASWTANWESTSAPCECPPDASEPDRVSAPNLADSPAGITCGSDVDARHVFAAANTRTTWTVSGDDAADLDIELLTEDGVILSRAAAEGSTETLVYDTLRDEALGLRVYSWAGLPDAERSRWSVTSTSTPLSLCEGDAECADGELCLDGRCARTRCIRNDDCPDRAICPRADLEAADRICALSCNGDESCGDGQVCKAFEDGRACASPGDGEPGGECRSAGDCGGAAVCIDWPGGYCAVAACDLEGVCGSGTACGVIEGRAVCLQTCWESDSVCTREGVSCSEVFAPNTELAYACLPEVR